MKKQLTSSCAAGWSEVLGWRSVPPRARLVRLDGHVGRGVGDAGQHEALANLVVVQEGLIRLIHLASLLGRRREGL